MKKKKILFLLTLFLLVQNNALAYLDPGTGSIILQLLAAAAASIAVFYGFILEKIKSIFKKIKKIFKKKEDQGGLK